MYYINDCRFEGLQEAEMERRMWQWVISEYKSSYVMYMYCMMILTVYTEDGTLGNKQGKI